MKYRRINNSIILNEDLLKKNEKNKYLYKYLLDNNVAYYYSKFISRNSNHYEKKIEEAGSAFNSKYIKTLKLIKNISIANNIPFLLFKTFKYIPEVVDGDIDILVKSQDYKKWILLLKKADFKCEEEDRLCKASCIKEGFCKIEPRIDVSFHNYTIIKEKKLWERVEYVNIAKMKIAKVEANIDICSLLLNTLYGPNYIRLYTFNIIKKIDLTKTPEFLSATVHDDLKLILEEAGKKNVSDKKFPIFLNDSPFFIWWVRKILLSNSFTFNYKFKHVIFFYYVKYRYVLSNKLYFAHDWKVI